MNFKNRELRKLRVNDVGLDANCPDNMGTEEEKDIFRLAATDLITFAQQLNDVKKQNWLNKTWSQFKRKGGQDLPNPTYTFLKEILSYCLSDNTENLKKFKQHILYYRNEIDKEDTNLNAVLPFFVFSEFWKRQGNTFQPNPSKSEMYKENLKSNNNCIPVNNSYAYVFAFWDAINNFNKIGDGTQKLTKNEFDTNYRMQRQAATDLLVYLKYASILEFYMPDDWKDVKTAARIYEFEEYLSDDNNAQVLRKFVFASIFSYTPDKDLQIRNKPPDLFQDKNLNIAVQKRYKEMFEAYENLLERQLKPIVDEPKIYIFPTFDPLSVIREVIENKNLNAATSSLEKSINLMKTYLMNSIAILNVQSDTETIIKNNLIVYNAAKLFAALKEQKTAEKLATESKAAQQLLRDARKKTLNDMKRSIFTEPISATKLAWCKASFVQLVAQETLYDQHWTYYTLDAAQRAQGVSQRHLEKASNTAHLPTGTVVAIDNMVSTIRAFNEQAQETAKRESEHRALANKCGEIILNCVDRIKAIRNDDKDFETLLIDNLEDTNVIKQIKTVLREKLTSADFYKQMIKGDDVYTYDFNEQFCTSFIFAMNLILKGNPGTGKSESTKQYKHLLHKLQLIDDKLVTCSVADVHGQYIGETAAKTTRRILESLDGILFLDEAYAMVDNTSRGGNNVNFGAEFNGVLVERMSRTPMLFHVVAAGYGKEMDTIFLASNPGYSRRFRTQITAQPTYTELVTATTKLLNDAGIKKTKSEVTSTLNKHMENNALYNDFKAKHDGLGVEDRKRLYFFPSFFGACQEVALLFMNTEFPAKLPLIFESLRSQEMKSTRRINRSAGDVIDENASMLKRVGRFGEQNLIDWELAEPLLKGVL